MSHINLPLAFVPDEIRTWIQRGWKLGSQEDVYQVTEENRGVAENGSTSLAQRDYDRMERWLVMTPRSRPSESNEFLRALVCEMAATYNNLPTAYAIDQTKMFIPDNESKDLELRKSKRFRDALRQYQAMSLQQKSTWQQAVLQRYPRLEEVLSTISHDQSEA